MQETEWRVRDYFGDLSEDCLTAFRLFHVELLRFNQKMNLISTYTEKNADILHFYDSIVASQFIHKEMGKKEEIFDFGSGNGFPAIIFSVLYPETNIFMVEVDERKAEFLKHIIARLDLKNANVLQMKVEDVMMGTGQTAMCRAFSNLARTLLVSSKGFDKGGQIFSLKGPDWFSELTALPHQICSTWNTEMSYEYELPDNLGTRVILKSTKIV